MKKNTLTNRDLYLSYKYKKYPDNPNTVPNPYFPKSEHTNSEYSLKIDEWKEIINCYMDVLGDYLIQGNVFVAPHNMGTFKMLKYKNANNKEKRTKYKYDEDDSNYIYSEYRLILKWLKERKYSHSIWKLNNYRVSIGRSFRKKLYLNMKQNSNNILNYPNT